MVDQSYWKQREADERSWINQNIANDAEFNKYLDQHYQTALDNIQKDIENEYAKYAASSSQTVAQARLAVKQEDVAAYARQAKQIVQQAQDSYAKTGKKLTYADFSSEVNDRLKLYNATMRINRLELLKSKIGLELTNAGVQVKGDMLNKLSDDYVKEIKRQAGILKETVNPDDYQNTLKLIMAKTNGGYNFSDRIWLNSDIVKARLDSLLARTMIEGQNPRVIARQLRDQVKDTVNFQKSAVERIARSESARIQTQAQLYSFKKYGYDYVKWNNEPTACRVCMSIGSGGIGGDGVYKTVDVPDIPVHPNCRCSISAWYDPN